MLRDLLKTSHAGGQHSLVSTNSVIQRQRLFAAKHGDSYFVRCLYVTNVNIFWNLGILEAREF